MRLTLEEVGYSYGISGGGFSLEGLSLSVSDGDFVGVIGHSGSGKSTLIQLAAALIQPTSGRVLLDGADLARPANRSRLFMRIGVAFQYPEAQLFAPTVYDDIAFAARNAGLAAEDVDRRVRRWMHVFGLSFDAVSGRSPFELSGGEQRRVALAGIMVVEPELLILDEPTAGLDPSGRIGLLRVIDDYYAAGHSVIMVSHSMEDIAQVVNRILVLRDGREYLQGTPSEVFGQSGMLRASGLGVPASEAFAQELREAGLELPPSLLSVDALADAITAAMGRRGFQTPDAADGITQAGQGAG
jgi:energy-coupling factor transport system ATP-binding protein